MQLPNEQEIQEVNHNFKYHAPTDAKRPKYEVLRDIYRDVALSLLSFCPPSRERSVALTNLEQSLMWGIASIARSPEEIQDAQDAILSAAEPAEELITPEPEENDGN